MSVFFIADDEITEGLTPQGILSGQLEPVIEPNHIETVVARIPHGNHFKVWKYSRYWHNTALDSEPSENKVEDEFEMYNLTDDPYEEINLVHPSNQNPKVSQIENLLAELLEEQRAKKRLQPYSFESDGSPR